MFTLIALTRAKKRILKELHQKQDYTENLILHPIKLVIYITGFFLKISVVLMITILSFLLYLILSFVEKKSNSKKEKNTSIRPVGQAFQQDSKPKVSSNHYRVKHKAPISKAKAKKIIS